MTRTAILCERFEYPVELRSVLDAVVDSARASLGEAAIIVLSPSVSTGDFLWRRTEAGVELMSDLDGFVFTDAPAGRIADFEQTIARLAKEQGDPFLEIDLSVSRRAALAALPETFQMVETGLAGFELVGDGALARFPTRFDPGASRQALLLNLWKPLASDEPDALARNVARSLLDIPLIATSEAGHCVPGHRARAEAFLADPPEPFANEPVLAAALELALAARTDPPGDPAALAAVVVPALGAMLSRLDGGPPLPSRPDASLVRRFARWIPRRTPRRLMGELRSVLRRPSGPVRDLRWWERRKEALGAAVCWGLLVSRFGGEAIAPETLDLLAAFAREPRLDLESPDLLEAARRQYRRGFVELYPSRAS